MRPVGQNWAVARRGGPESLSAMHSIRLVLIVLLAQTALHAQTAAAGADARAFIEIKEGALPLIITVPHGGLLKPVGLKNRAFGKVMMDAQTVELAADIDAAVRRRLGSAPHFIINRLHRSKLDPNREVEEAAQDDPLARDAWQRFHAACAAAKQRVKARHGGGLLLDLHGHRHEEPNVELGYLLRSQDLRLSDGKLSADAGLLARCSIRGMVTHTGKSLAELVRGPMSLGTLLEIQGQRTLPSAVRPHPSEGAEYFSGVFIIGAHGSRDDNGLVSAIQVECPWDGVRDTAENRGLFAQRLAEALAEFLPAHFNWKPAPAAGE